MFYPRDNDLNEIADTDDSQFLVLDGTANLDYFDDEQIPRVKGLIELLNQYFGARE
jgi:hypothetical protein